MVGVVALDLGTKLGIYIEGKDHASTCDLGKGDDRFIRFFHKLDAMFNPTKTVYTIVYEEAAFQRGNAIPIYHGLVGVLKAVCKKYDVEYIGIPVGTIKKTFTGKGNCNKEEIMKRCDELNISYDDDNSADAYAVYYTYKEQQNVK